MPKLHNVAMSGFLVAIILAGLGFLSGGILLLGSAGSGELAPEIISPELLLLRANGIDLPNKTEIAQTVIRLDGQTYRVLRYTVRGEPALQIARDSSLITDPDLGYRILLTYAWSSSDARVTADEVKAMEAMLSRVRGYREGYSAIFGLALALEPAVQAVDKLKHHTVNGPRVQVGKVVLVEINDLWDVICWIPVDATNLCLLEPLVREIHDRGVTLEQSLTVTGDDLALLVKLIKQDGTAPADGLQRKQAMEKVLNSLQDLDHSTSDLDQRIVTAERLTSRLVAGLRSPNWNPMLEKVIGTLLTVDPSLDLHALAREAADPLADLDKRLNEYHSATSGFSADVNARVAYLQQIRNRTDQTVRGLGRLWRAPSPQPGPGTSVPGK